MSPADATFSLLSCPHPPTPPSRREGGDFCYFIARGFAPCIPGAGGTRHGLGFEEAILLGIAGGRRLQLQSITNSRKVLGGLGASFKKPPTFLRSPVPSLSRSFALPFLCSPVLKRLTGQDKPALSVVLGLFTEGYGYACGGSGQPRRAAGR